MVINVTPYLDNHPGGKHLISHNIGRDVSKFFYGGYALDSLSAKPHAHSPGAYQMATSL